MFLFPICPDVCASRNRHQVAASALHGEEEEEEVSRPGTLTPWTYFDNFPLICHLVFNSLCVCNCAQALFMFQVHDFLCHILICCCHVFMLMYCSFLAPVYFLWTFYISDFLAWTNFELPRDRNGKTQVEAVPNTELFVLNSEFLGSFRADWRSIWQFGGWI